MMENGPVCYHSTVLRKEQKFIYRFTQRTENSRASSNSSTGSCHVLKHLVYRFIILLEHCSYKAHTS